METPLIRVEDHRGYNQAEQDAAYDGGQGSGGAAIQFHHLKAHEPVSNAETQRAHQQQLLEREYAENAELAAAQEGVSHQRAQRPVDTKSYNPAPGTGDGSGPDRRSAKPLARPFLPAR